MSQTELLPRAARRFLPRTPEPTTQLEPRTEEGRAVATDETHQPATGNVAGPAARSRLLIERAIARIAVQVGRVAWLATSDQGRAAIWRVASHLVVLAVILSAGALTAFVKPEHAAGRSVTPGNPDPGNVVFGALVPSSSRQTEDEENFNQSGFGGPILIDQTIVLPLANPYTTIPSRERRGIIRYTVQAGDTLFGIAAMYGLTPETLLWANYDELQDNPHLLRPGMELNIPPVNGIVYVVKPGDTVESIAAEYKATPDAIYVDGYEWNQLKPGEQPAVGASLIIPGGSREFKAWALSAAENAPQQPSSSGTVVARGSVGFCKDITGGLTGTGTFIWPTAKHWVSGNNYAPWHPGLDLAAQMGDPIIASDNGVVVYAGWNDWGYGNLVVIDHGNGWQTWYAHNSAIYVECGQNVFQGSTIAAAGSTGRSTGPHLHFETRLNGTIPNPFNVLPPP